MAKKSMQIKYKSKKRERNKYNPELDSDNSVKGFFIVLGGVLIFLGLMYLMIFGLEKLGLFQKGYTSPTKETTKISYEYIPIGTVFTRSEKSYYVLFDNYKDSLSSDAYINQKLSSLKIIYYKVDMSLSENSKYVSNKSNKKATRSNELSINGITLIKISNGRISEYYEGREEIEAYLNK